MRRLDKLLLSRPVLWWMMDTEGKTTGSVDRMGFGLVARALPGMNEVELGIGNRRRLIQVSNPLLNHSPNSVVGA